MATGTWRSPDARLLRDSPLNSIWEGSGNVSALDVLRALGREPEALPAFLAECELARGATAARRPARPARRARSEDPEFEARRVVAELALALQASLLVRNAPPAVADAFCAGRLDGRRRAGIRDSARRGRRGRDHRAGARRLTPLTYEVTGRVARITLDRPERGNATRLP